MDKKLIYIVVGIVVLLLLVGGGAYWMMKKGAAPAAPQQTTPVTQTTPTQPTQTAPAMQTLKDLLTAGTAQKCTYQDTAAGNVSGTTYVSAGKVRADFTTTAGKTTISGHMISDGKTSWIWMDGQLTGFKMAFDQTSTPSAGSAPQGVDVNKAMNYSCSVWTADATMFTPPATVNFTDLNSMKIPSAPPVVPPKVPTNPYSY